MMENLCGGRATRARFLRNSVVAGGIVVGGGALAGVAQAAHTDGVEDVDVLNYALTLEYLEASFYTAALGGAGTTGVPASRGKLGWLDYLRSRSFRTFGVIVRNTFDYLGDIRNHEVAHVDFLRSALGGAAVPACTFDFASALGDFDSFVATARVLENTGVMAYDGAIRYVENGDYLQAGAQIATVEARHAAFLNLLEQASPFPDAFDMGKKPSEILAAVQATGFIVSCPPVVLQLFTRLP